MIEVLNDRSVIHIYGSDSEKFLQGQVTNDIIRNKYSYNYLLNNQGRFLFDFFVYRKSSESFYIDIHSSAVKKFTLRLSMYKLRSDVEFIDVSDNLAVLYSYQVIQKKPLFSIQDPRNNQLGFRTTIEKSRLKVFTEFTENLYLKDKYELSIIDGDSDLVYEKSIPIEYGADDMNSISYEKGCYVGQEIISRAKYQGVIRKKIYKLKFGTEVAQNTLEDTITDLDGNKIGIVCSSYSDLAIGLIREEKYLGLKQKVAMIGNKLADVLIPPWRD